MYSCSPTLSRACLAAQTSLVAGPMNTPRTAADDIFLRARKIEAGVTSDGLDKLQLACESLTCDLPAATKPHQTSLPR